MRIKSIFAGSIAAMMLAACSQDIANVNEKDTINFSVSSVTTTRAADSYCNNLLPRSFKVWAQNTDDNSAYFSGDIITNMGGNPVRWENQTGNRYWPENTLNFFAEVNGDQEFDYNDGNPRFNNFTVKDNVLEQVDLMYAQKLNQGKTAMAINLNFRHALSQVAFKARCTNPNIHVEVMGVSVGHIGNNASFSFPQGEGTDQNWEDPDHNDIEHDVTLPGQGTWTDAQNGTLKQYDVTFSPVALGSEITNLTAPESNHQNGFANVLTLIPQVANAWNPAQKGADFNGAYFLVKCKIYNVAGNEFNAATDKVLYNGDAAIPVAIDWKQGKRYIYTFTFNNGNGGYTPDPNDPKPVLTAIDYSVSVDDFVPVDGGDNGMNGGNETTTYNYRLLYDGNGQGVTGVPAAETYSGKETMHEFIVSSSVPAREGYTFKGWAETAAGNVKYTAGDPVTLLNENPTKTIYAIWEKNPEETLFELRFDGNQPGQYVPTNIPAAMTFKAVAESHQFTVPTFAEGQAPTSGNYKFMGWADSKDAKKVQYKGGDVITVTKESPLKTIYAVWGTQVSGGGAGGGTGTDW